MHSFASVSILFHLYNVLVELIKHCITVRMLLDAGWMSHVGVAILCVCSRSRFLTLLGHACTMQGRWVSLRIAMFLDTSLSLSHVKGFSFLVIFWYLMVDLGGWQCCYSGYYYTSIYVTSILLTCYWLFNFKASFVRWFQRTILWSSDQCRESMINVNEPKSLPSLFFIVCFITSSTCLVCLLTLCSTSKVLISKQQSLGCNFLSIPIVIVFCAYTVLNSQEITHNNYIPVLITHIIVQSTSYLHSHYIKLPWVVVSYQIIEPQLSWER